MPVWLAPRVVVYALDETRPAGEGTVALPQRPSAAFGDGSHPTTRLCTRAVDLLCRQRNPHAVLDVGTGTGVLARVARAHGATFLAATDIDPVALAAARANVVLDDADATTPIWIGDRAPDAWGARFDLVVANILEQPLLRLAPALTGALAPDGVLLLSGFTRPQAPTLRAAFERAGARYTTRATLDGWVVLQLVR